ncbi:MAG: flagellar hook-associated protein FlgK [Candidatus Latescibacteria bacterium]|nr:flagellar hook-associated protein FlgK [bacterium]MBD3425257.1 flagellar hook-associated protein FlgK [Candidatus Latescibacterota bacterium]
MTSLFGLIEMNRRSLFCSQYSLQTTNHNISNVNTPGYSRQEVLYKANYPSRTGVGILGNGVTVSEIRRANSDFYTEQIRREKTLKSDWDAASTVLGKMEIIFNEPSENGMASAIENFFQSWNDLASDPSSESARASVKESARMLCQKFHSMDSSLMELESSINQQINEKTESLNEMLARVAELNDQIAGDEAQMVKTAADLRDERDRVLEEISHLVSVDVKEDEFGSVDLYINGRNIVHKTEFKELGTVLESGTDEPDLYIGFKGSHRSLDAGSGELASLIQSRDGYLTDARESLDRIAEVIISSVNEIHNRGWTPSGSGYDFFEGTDASDIRIAQAIEDNSSLIASSYDGTVGDNSLANDMVALADQTISGEDSQTLNELYQGTVSAIGIHSQNAQNMVRNEQLILDNLEMRKESITGVNMDEELMNLSKYQQSYQAAAKVMDVVSGLIQTVLDM